MCFIWKTSDKENSLQIIKLCFYFKYFFIFIQEIINLLPNLNSEELIKAYSAKNNDMMFAIYICAMTRCVLTLHTLIFVGKDNEEK